MRKFIAFFLLLAPVLSSTQAPPPPQPSVRLGGDVAMANLLVRVEPQYPAVARAARVQGKVMVQALISKEGTVTTYGASGGHPLLNDAALQAVRQWQFRPIVLLYEPANVTTFLPVNLSIDPPTNASRLAGGNAIITGQIRHADGRPASTAFVFASVIGSETPAVSDLVQANSTGEYRITNLPRGTYQIQAGTATGPSIYYPGVANPNGANPISVASDETTVTRIDFTIP